MTRYYLTCRSLTYAQRTARVLDAAGISNKMTRTIQGMNTEGCGYAVTVREGTLLDALDVLKKSKLPPRKVFALLDGGAIREVAP